MRSTRSLTLFALVLVLALLSGCSTLATVHRMPAGGDAVTAPAAKVPGLHVHLVDVKITEPTGTGTPIPAITQWQEHTLGATGLFEAVRVEPSLVAPGLPAAGLKPLTDNYVEARVDLTFVEDLHFAGNMAKALFGGLTLYTLSPVLSYYYDSDLLLSIEITRRDGTKKIYSADAGAQVKYGYWANKWTAPREAKKAAMLAASQAIVAQMVADREFFTAVATKN